MPPAVWVDVAERGSTGYDLGMAWALQQGDIRHAAIVSFEIAPSALAPLVPCGTELDTYAGRALVSVVAFHFANNRVLGVPLPFARDYDQVNFRLYVRRLQPDGSWRHGVVFVREMTPASPVVTGARFVYGENFDCVPVTSRVREPDAQAVRAGRALYRWRDDRLVHRLAVDFSGPAAVPAPGSLEEFLAERHFGYVAADRATREYRVDHPPWRIWRATAARLSPAAADSFGPRFARALARDPVSAFVAEGSHVLLHRPHALRGTARADAAVDAARYAPP